MRSGLDFKEGRLAGFHESKFNMFQSRLWRKRHCATGLRDQSMKLITDVSCFLSTHRQHSPPDGEWFS